MQIIAEFFEFSDIVERTVILLWSKARQLTAHPDILDAGRLTAAFEEAASPGSFPNVA